MTNVKTRGAGPAEHAHTILSGTRAELTLDHPYARDYRRHRTGKLKSMPHYAHRKYEGISRQDAAKLRRAVADTLNRPRRAEPKPPTEPLPTPPQPPAIPPELLVEAFELLVSRRSDGLESAERALAVVRKMCEDAR